MREYEIVDTNADNIDGCSLCGNKNANNPGRRRKANWLKERYAEGLRYKVLRCREFGDVGMIEYAPGSGAWRPVEAAGYLVIHCLMVLRKHGAKGLGMLLLDSCLRDAKRSKCRGVAVVTSSDSFMARSDLFIKAGFTPVDSIPPYELLVKKFKKSTPDPRFIVDRERVLKRIAETSRALGLKTKVVHIRSAKESRELPTPYGVFSIIYDGKLIAERPISGTRFTNIMHKLGTKRGMPIGIKSGQGD